MPKNTSPKKESQFPLLATKLFVPHPRPDQVNRSHLIDQLNEGVSRKLTLISAPAGFGKTTLLSEWIAQGSQSVAWISLDKSENDPVQFIHYLIAAVQNSYPKIGEAALSQLQSSQRPPVESILISLIQDFSGLSDELIIVLDDYHSIDADSIHQLIRTLLDYLPVQVHLTISSRVDPPLPLARLRVNQQLSELRTNDLCFTEAEIAVFFNQTLNLQLTSGDISILESRTEGWIAGLQLAALSMQGRPDITSFINTFAGDDRHIVDYLVEEVLNLQSEQIQKFLLQTSILSRFSEPLCTFITGESGSQKILNDLEKANLFIVSLDDKRHWYRYHHLFAELLQQRLQHSMGDRVSELHKMASRWYEQNGDIDEAVTHAFEAGDYEQAAQLIGEYVKGSWEYDTKMLVWHKKLPPEFVRQDAELSFFNAWMLEKGGQYEAAEEFFDITERLIDAKSVESRESRFLLGKIAAIRANMALYKNEISEVIRFSEKAIEFLQDGESSWRIHSKNIQGQAHFVNGEIGKAYRIFQDVASEGDQTGDFHAYLKGRIGQAAIQTTRGQLSDVIDIYSELYQKAQDKKLSQIPMMGWLYLNWGRVLGYQNYTNEALRYIQQGLEFSEQIDDAAMIGEGNFNLVSALLIKGDTIGAEAAIEKTKTLAEQKDIPIWVVDSLEVQQVRIELNKGNLEPALQWMQGQKPGKDGSYKHLQLAKRILVARILFANNEVDDSLEILRPLTRTPKNDGWVIEQIVAILIQARILKSRDEMSEAISLVKKALSLAEPGSIISVFIEEGAPIAELLEVILDEITDLPRAFINKILSAFRLTKLIRTEDEFVEHLSERELEVLRLIAAGLPNKTITEELFISMSTVKTHLRNIYSKLNVASRTQATAKAKELGLL